MDPPRLAEVPNVPIRTLAREIPAPYTIQIRVSISYIEKVSTLLLHKLEVSIQVIALVLQDPLTYISFLLKHLTNVITRQIFPRFLDRLLQLFSVLAIIQVDLLLHPAEHAHVTHIKIWRLRGLSLLDDPGLSFFILIPYFTYTLLT